MTNAVIASASIDGARGIELAGLPLRPAAWRRYLLPAISFALLIAAGNELWRMDLRAVARLLPHSLGFALLFAAFYLAGPVADWAIFRRLWRLPVAALPVLMRKTISNEILLGYSGELYFYGWARRNVRLEGAPFGAIKDVAILSAAVGNAATLLLLAASWPMLGNLHLGLGGKMLAASIGTVALSSLAALLFRRRLFSLPTEQLRYIAGAHTLRIIASTLLVGALWWYLMPGAPLHWWLLLATIRLLVSRLPFIPNKDLTFAAVSAYLIGAHAEVSDLLALVAGLVLATHVILGATFAIGDMLGIGRVPIEADA